MNTQEIKALKKRCEAVVRRGYEYGKQLAAANPDVKGVTPSAKWLSFRDEAIPSIAVKQKKGGFVINLGKHLFGEKTDPMIHYAAGRSGELELIIQQPEKVLAALDVLEQNLEAFIDAGIDERIGEELAAKQKRLDERAAKQQQELAEARQAYQDNAATIEAILSAADKILKVLNVKETLVDTTRAQPVKAKDRLTIIPGDGVVVAIMDNTLYYANRVVNRFGLRIEGIKVKIDTDDHTLHYRDLDDLKSMRDFLIANQEDPLAAARKAGVCVFCSLPLTDDESRRRGYGPQCAFNQDMPYGGSA